MTAESSFFVNSGDDDLLESRNRVFWESMLDNIRRDGFVRMPQRVLDIGCHRGGLLARINELWGTQDLWGIEPLAAARARAKLRLRAVAGEVHLLDPGQWRLVPDRSMDLVVCHEVLFLVADIEALVADIARVLGPGGRAYIVWGCHAENPAWQSWREVLAADGKTVYTHQPLALMSAAGAHGLTPAVRPLRDSGWASYDPTDSFFGYANVATLMDHQFRYKLLFRLTKQ